MLPRPKYRVSEEPFRTAGETTVSQRGAARADETRGRLLLPFTLATRSVVPALSTLSSVGVAQVSVAVALAGAAAREAPLAS